MAYLAPIAVVAGVLAAALAALLLWIHVFAFGSVAIVNNSGAPIVGGRLDTYYGSRSLPEIQAGESRRFFFRWRTAGRDPWAVELQLADDRQVFAESGYRSHLDLWTHDTLSVSAPGARGENIP